MKIMQKELYYLYLGENGTILTPIKLEGIYSVKKYFLTADQDKKLTKNGIDFYSHITIPASELDEWYEV